MRYVNKDGFDILETDIDLTKGYLIDTYALKPDVKPIDNITKFVWDDDDLDPVKMYFEYEPGYLDRMAYYSAKSSLVETDYIFSKLMEDLVTECHGITDLIAILSKYAKEYGETIKSRKEWRQVVRDLKSKVEPE